MQNTIAIAWKDLIEQELRALGMPPRFRGSDQKKQQLERNAFENAFEDFETRANQERGVKKSQVVGENADQYRIDLEQWIKEHMEFTRAWAREYIPSVHPEIKVPV